MTPETDTTQRPVVEYDHHSPDMVHQGEEYQRKARETCPVAWSESYGGFWVVTGYDAAARVGRAPEQFSSEKDIDGTKRGYQGTTLPPASAALRFLPIEADPPEQTNYRRVLNPPFAPVAVASWRPLITELTNAAIDRVIDSGRLDFVTDITGPVTGRFMVAFLGLGDDDDAGWERWAEPIHDLCAYLPETPQHNQAIEGVMWMLGRIAQLIPERRADPGTDIISYLTQAEIDGQPIPDQQIVEILYTVIAGGVDTTMSLLCSVFLWLSEHPEERQRLVDEPALMATAREEFLRYFSPAPNFARTVAADVQLEGQTLRSGDRMLVCYGAANRDPSAFDRAGEIDLGRGQNPHLAFGTGTHRCLGSNFARVEIDIVLRTVLERLPDFVVDGDESQRYASIGNVDGWVRMPASFTPGPRHAAS